jgi:hypothetical protein
MVTELYVRLAIALETLATVLPKKALYRIGPVLLHKLSLYNKSLLAMLDILSIYGVEGTFSQREIVDAI